MGKLSEPIGTPDPELIHVLRPVSVTRGALNTLGQPEYRARLACDFCDTTVYLAVAPVELGEGFVDAMAAMHEVAPRRTLPE